MHGPLENIEGKFRDGHWLGRSQKKGRGGVGEEYEGENRERAGCCNGAVTILFSAKLDGIVTWIQPVTIRPKFLQFFLQTLLSHRDVFLL